MPPYNPNRLFVSGGFKHFRRHYSKVEVRAGLVVFVLLIGIAVWVGWRGTLRPPELYGAVALEASGASSAALSSDVATAIPSSLLDASSWRETARLQFDAKNLYEKIDGRSDFFISKGFVALHFVTLARVDNPSTLIDIELYDMGTVAGALSAFGAERKDGSVVTETDAGQSYQSRNALFLVQDKFYARAVGSDESPSVRAGLATIRSSLEQSLTRGQRSWALELFVDSLHLDAGAVSFVGKNAFSIEGARRLWVAEVAAKKPTDKDLPGTDSSVIEWFVSSYPNKNSARAAALVLMTGFASYGKPAPGSAGGDTWIIDEFLGTYTSVRTIGPFVVGVRSAPTRQVGQQALERLADAIGGLGPEVTARAIQAATRAAEKSSTDSVDGEMNDLESTDHSEEDAL